LDDWIDIIISHLMSFSSVMTTWFGQRVITSDDAAGQTGEQLKQTTPFSRCCCSGCMTHTDRSGKATTGTRWIARRMIGAKEG
jgi:hypothetical protein